MGFLVVGDEGCSGMREAVVACSEGEGKKEPGDGGTHEVGERSGKDGPQAEARDGLAAIGSDSSEPAEENCNGREVREATQGEGHNTL